MTCRMISLEILLLSASVLVALTSTYLSWASKPGRLRTIAFSVALLCSVFAAIAVYEIETNERKIRNESSRLERHWLTVRDSLISEIEIEIISPDGVIDYDVAINALEGVKLNFNGLESHSSLASIVSLSDIDSKNSGSNITRVGVLAVTVSMPRSGGNDTTEFESHRCVASNHNLISHKDKVGHANAVCSVTKSWNLSGRNIRVSELFAATLWDLTVPQLKLGCLDPCRAVGFSIRARMASGTESKPDIIELSPSSYMNRPSRVYNGKLQYSMSGTSMEQLIKSEYVADGSLVTENGGGAVSSFLWRLISYQKTTRGTVVEIIWSTDSKITLDTIKNYIPETAHDGELLLLRRYKWCGIAVSDICWNVFVVVSSEGTAE